MTKHYRNAGGDFLGSFDGGRHAGVELSHPDVPPEAIEVASAPAHAAQKWDGSAWITPQSLADALARDADTASLRDGGKDIALVLTELIDWLIANKGLQATDFSPQGEQAYGDLKAIAERVKT